MISETLKSMSPVSLDVINAVKLMNRYDSKYRLKIEKLGNILKNISDHYYILEINGKQIQEYKTIYYDTPDNFFYLSHHNGRLKRIKIRKRDYVNSGIFFLEIKKKNNKGKTEKKRIQIKKSGNWLLNDELNFLENNLGSQKLIKKLSVKSKNFFRRITLVNKNFTERCTIDLNLSFYSDTQVYKIADLAVIELKTALQNQKTPLSVELKKNNIYVNGFSKYCIGRALLNPSLKTNLFKQKLTEINKNYNITSTKKKSENFQLIN